MDGKSDGIYTAPSELDMTVSNVHVITGQAER
jgi:hypothetical protein